MLEVFLKVVQLVFRLLLWAQINSQLMQKGLISIKYNIKIWKNNLQSVQKGEGPNTLSLTSEC